MCRLFALTSTSPVSPMLAINALNVMKEGHDGSGVGLYLSGLEGPFAAHEGRPVLSGIFTDAGRKRLDALMKERGFRPVHSLEIRKTDPPAGTPRRGMYLAQVYEPAPAWEELSAAHRAASLVETRVAIREAGEEKRDMMAFSFWPGVVMIKEVGDPLTIGRWLDLDRSDLHARRILCQGRQNTNYAINLYACHPFFIEGVCTMTNGENTAFVPIREYLQTRGIPGYMGYQSDSEVFAHILHFTLRRLGLPLEAYKHVITPLRGAELAEHPDSATLTRLQTVCRRMIIDGPNCVIGVTPEGTMFMVQDRKKLRPGVVGGKPGIYAFSSEICGLDAAIPDRNPALDFQPMHLDTAYVRPDCQEVTVCSQLKALPPRP